MTDINALNGYTQSGTNSSSQQASNQLSADMNTFLTLLTTQLKYQDPLDPMDTAEFTNQLVQYSSVEQAIQTNSKLETLLNLNMSNLGAQAVSYIGKIAQVLGDVMPLEDGHAKATYTLDKNVESAVIMVKDLDGNVVYSEQGKIVAGTHDFEWDGKDSDGSGVPVITARLIFSMLMIFSIYNSFLIILFRFCGCAVVSAAAPAHAVLHKCCSEWPRAF